MDTVNLEAAVEIDTTNKFAPSLIVEMTAKLDIPFSVNMEKPVSFQKEESVPTNTLQWLKIMMLWKTK